MKKHKVIGIGFHKTGTTTLKAALTSLGFNVQGVKKELATALFKDDLESVFKLTQGYDAFQDNPWPLLYKEIDKWYPNSKFILTIRDKERWIRSVVNHFGQKHTEMRRWIYGVGHPLGNESIYLEKYDKHNAEVVEYFRHRKEDFLVVDWEKGDGWKSLCDFLYEPFPDLPFPHAKKGNYSKTKTSWIKQIVAEVKKILRYPN